jgi:hypothetical protein
MMTRIRLLYVLVAGLCALLVAGTFQPSLLALVAPDGQETDSPRIAQEEQRAANLDGKPAIFTQRIKAKQNLVRQLVDREITLFEAAAWFLYFNDRPPECRDPFRNHIQGASDEEKVCRQVIRWARAELTTAASTSQANLEVERLERELREHIAGNGRVVLPNWW